MGDRGNIVMEQEDGNRIYFYSHWGGSDLPHVVQEALNRGQDRWDDEAYLARIIFCELVRGNEPSTTGYGISTYECDNEHPHVVVNSSKQTVTIDDQTIPFKDFVEINVREYWPDF
jgi:hypothetical protein